MGRQPVHRPFEVLARASLGMGYGLEEFIRFAGFDPFGDALDKIGAGGDGAGQVDSGSGSAENGGDGLLILCNYEHEESAELGTPCVMVFVCRVDGYSLIRRRDHAADFGMPEVENFPNSDPTPGASQNMTMPADAGAVATVHAWGGGGGGS